MMTNQEIERKYELARNATVLHVKNTATITLKKDVGVGFVMFYATPHKRDLGYTLYTVDCVSGKNTIEYNCSKSSLNFVIHTLSANGFVRGH